MSITMASITAAVVTQLSQIVAVQGLGELSDTPVGSVTVASTLYVTQLFQTQIFFHGMTDVLTPWGFGPDLGP